MWMTSRRTQEVDMRLGVQLPEVERLVRWPEYVAMARAAEEVGFDSVWLRAHPLYPAPRRGGGGAVGRRDPARRSRRRDVARPARPARVLHSFCAARAAGP